MRICGDLHARFFFAGHPPGRRATPAASCAFLKAALFDWWVANHATEGQKAIFAAAQEVANRFRHGSRPLFEEYNLYVADPQGTCNYDGKGFMVSVKSWDDVRKAV